MAFTWDLEANLAQRKQVGYDVHEGSDTGKKQLHVFFCICVVQLWQFVSIDVCHVQHMSCEALEVEHVQGMIQAQKYKQRAGNIDRSGPYKQTNQFLGLTLKLLRSTLKPWT